MKRIHFSKMLMLAVIPLALAFASCNEDKDPAEVPEITVDGKNNATVDFGSTADQKSATVLSNYSWELEIPEGSDWVSITPTTGNSGSTEIHITTQENDGGARTATFSFKVSLSSIGIEVATLVIKQGASGSVDPDTAIYYENAGDERFPKGDNWPYVDQYQAWKRGGSIDQSSVVYSGSSASVRCSGSGWEPGDTSIAGEPYVYVGNGGRFVIGQVATGGKTNFTYQFAVQHTISSSQNESGSYIPETGEITSSLFGLYAGFDGTNYAKVDFTVNSSSDNGWQVVTAMFQVPAGTSQLYFKYDDFNAGSGQSLRVDEIKLLEGGTGPLINPGGTPDPVDGLYYENVGDERFSKGSAWPSVEDYTAWKRGGTITQSAVTYSGASEVRCSGSGWEPGDTSIAGEPYVYIGNGGRFIIGKVSTGGKTNFTYQFAAQHTISSSQNESGSYVPNTGEINSSLFALYVGFDGTNYANVDFTVNSASDNGWQVVTTMFQVPAGTTELYFKYDNFNPGSGQSLRVDEMTLSEGGTGPLINPGGDTDPETYKSIAEVRAMYTGSDVNITENYYTTGVVIVDLYENNVASLKNLMIYDQASAKGIAIRLSANATSEEYPLGAEVKVTLRGLTLTSFSGLVQLSADKSAVVKTGNTKSIVPVELTAEQFLAGDYQSMPVKIKDVQFISAHAGLAVNDASLTAKTYSFSTLEDASGNNVDVYISSYAKFFSTFTLPTLSGTLEGVGSMVTTPQLLPQSTAAFAGMTQPRFGGSKTFNVTPLTASAPATGGTVTINVTGDVAWTSNVSSGSSFASIAPDSGSGSGTITVTLQENDETTSREAQITVSTSETVATPSYTVTITQAGKSSGTSTEFSAIWSMQGKSGWGSTPAAPTSLIPVGGGNMVYGDLTMENIKAGSGSAAGNTWGGTGWDENTDPANPVRYAYFTVSSSSVFSIETLKLSIRISATGPLKTDVQYSLDGTNFTQLKVLEIATRPGSTTSYGFTETITEPALQGIAAGETVTFRLVPHEATNTGGVWYISNNAPVSGYSGQNLVVSGTYN